MTAVFDGENQHERDQSTGKEVGFRKITAPKVSVMIQANNDFEQAIFSGNLQHMQQPLFPVISEGITGKK